VDNDDNDDDDDDDWSRSCRRWAVTINGIVRDISSIVVIRVMLLVFIDAAHIVFLYLFYYPIKLIAQDYDAGKIQTFGLSDFTLYTLNFTLYTLHCATSDSVNRALSNL